MKCSAMATASTSYKPSRWSSGPPLQTMAHSKQGKVLPGLAVAFFVCVVAAVVSYAFLNQSPLLEVRSRTRAQDFIGSGGGTSSPPSPGNSHPAIHGHENPSEPLPQPNTPTNPVTSEVSELPVANPCELPTDHPDRHKCLLNSQDAAAENRASTEAPNVDIKVANEDTAGKENLDDQPELQYPAKVSLMEMVDVSAVEVLYAVLILVVFASIAATSFTRAEFRRLRMLVARYRPADRLSLDPADKEGVRLMSSDPKTAVERASYDAVFNIDSLVSFSEHGWTVRAPTRKKEIISALRASARLERSGSSRLRDGKVVAIVGGFSKGKSLLLNGLYRVDFPSSNLVHTEGVSLKWLENSKMILVDTAGSHSAVRAGSEEHLADRKAVEMFLQDLIFDMADYMVLVVNDLTWIDQEYISALTRRMKQLKRNILFVVHNFRDAYTERQLDQLWREQVEEPYAKCGNQDTFEDEVSGKYHFFTSQMDGVQLRHLRMAREGSEAGNKINQTTYRVLRNMLQALATTRPFDPASLILDYSKRALPRYLDGDIDLCWSELNGVEAPVDADDDKPREKILRLRTASAMPTDDDLGALQSSSGQTPGAQDSDVICVLRNRESAGSLTPKMRLSYSHTGLGVSVAAPDLEPEIDVIDTGSTLEVYMDVPGMIPPPTVTVDCNESESYVEVTGLRLRERGNEENKVCTGERVWQPNWQARRFGKLYARIIIPPLAQLREDSVVVKEGVLHFTVAKYNRKNAINPREERVETGTGSSSSSSSSPGPVNKLSGIANQESS